MLVDKSGHIKVENIGLEISPEFTLAEFKANQHFKDFEFNGANDGYERYRLGKVLIDGISFYMSFIFYKNKISQIGLAYVAFADIEKDNWTKIREQQDFIKKKHDEIMLEQHRAISITYPWGLIASFLDQSRGYHAHIIVRYNWSSRTDPTFVKSMPPIDPQRMPIDENGNINFMYGRFVITPKLAHNELKSAPKSSTFKYSGLLNTHCKMGKVILDAGIFEMDLLFSFPSKHISKLWMTFSSLIDPRNKGPLTPQERNSTRHFHDEWVLALKGCTTNRKELSKEEYIIEAVYPWGKVSSTSGRKDRPEIVVEYN